MHNKGERDAMDRKLKVLLATYSVDSRDISEAQQAYQWISHVARHVDLTVISTGSRLHDTCGLEDRDDLRYIQLPHTISWKRFDVLDRAIHPGVIDFNFKLAGLLRGKMKSERFDVCHSLSPFAPRYSTPLRKMDIPKVCGPLSGGLAIPKGFKEIISQEPFFFRLRQIDKLRIRWDPLLRATYEKATRLLVTAEYVRQQLLPRRLHPKTRLLSAIGIDLAPLSKMLADSQSFVHSDRGELRILYVGRIIPSKGLPYIIQALAQLPEELPVKLTVVGDGPHREHCEQLARQNNVSRKIDWAGEVPHDEVYSYFLAHDVFCFPSIKEAAGIVVLEAMALGRPVICVNNGGPADMVTTESGVVLPCEGPRQVVDDLAETFCRLCTRRDHLVQLSEGAIERVKKYDWDYLAERLASCYEEAYREAMH